MANKRISDLPALPAVGATNLDETSQASVSYKVAWSARMADINANATIDLAKSTGILQNSKTTATTASTADTIPLRNGMGVLEAKLIQSPIEDNLIAMDASGIAKDSGVAVTISSSSNDNTHVMTSAAVQSALAGIAGSAMDFIGGYDASVNTFPTVGSGTAGAVEKGDVWSITVAGTLGGTAVLPLDTLLALVNLPGQTAGNWAINGAVTKTYVDTQLALKANLASPTFTGTPAAPTQSQGDNSTKLATTAYTDTGLALKSNIASPTFTGVPAAPTASPGTNTTQLATTAFATAGLALKADLSSPALTGTPTAPTAAPGTNTTQLATTGFVTASAAAGTLQTSYTNSASPAVITLTTGKALTIKDTTGTISAVTVNPSGAVVIPALTATSLSSTSITTTNAAIYSMTVSGLGGALATVNAGGDIIPSTAINNFNGLKLSWASATTIGLSAGSYSSSDGVMHTLSGNVVINVANVGVVNGLDAGTIANNTDYYAYAISHTNSALNGGIISLNATSPTLPSGYVSSRYSGKLRYGTATFLPFIQTGNGTVRTTTYTGSSSLTQALTGGSSNSFAAVSLTSYVSPRCRRGRLRYDFDSAAGASSYLAVRDTGSSVAAGSALIAHCSGAASNAQRGMLDFICSSSQSIDYVLSVAGDACNLYVLSYEEEL